MMHCIRLHSAGKTYVEEVMNALAASGANTGDENRFQVK